MRSKIPFTWFVALRFLREGRLQTWLILAGVTVGVSVMIFLSALIGGLQENLILQTLGTQPHIIVRPREDAARPLLDRNQQTVVGRIEQPAQRLRSVENWPAVLRQVSALPEVVSATPVAAGPAFALRASSSRSVLVQGIEPDSYDAVIPLREKLKYGAWNPSGDQAVVGLELAKDLGVSVGDVLRLQTVTGQVQNLKVAGILDFNNKEFNQRWVFVTLRLAQTLLDLGGGVTSIQVKVKEIFAAEESALAIAGQTGLAADSWMATNAQLLIALRSQGSSSGMIQFFVVLAVALGIASVLAVAVIQKSREIGILKAMGTQPRQVSRIFLIQGGLVGLVGSVCGCLLGALLVGSFRSAVTFPIPLETSLILRSTAVALLTGMAAAYFPARRAARLDPAVAIHYE